MLGHSSTGIVAATLWLLIAFSVLSWTLIVMKGWLQFRLSRQNGAFIDAFWDAPNLSEAERIARQSQGPLAQVCLAGFDTLHQIGWDGTRNPQNSGDIQPVLERRLRAEAQKALRKLESGLMALASIGSTAPFVGLFGTVWGIMHALQDISRSGSAGLDVVAGPIGEALNLFEALQYHGAPSEMLIFPDENHWILKPRNIVAWYDTVLAFVGRHLKAE
jgi:biopolymer transport protein ExbB